MQAGFAMLEAGTVKSVKFETYSSRISRTLASVESYSGYLDMDLHTEEMMTTDLLEIPPITEIILLPFVSLVSTKIMPLVRVLAAAGLAGSSNGPLLLLRPLLCPEPSPEEQNSPHTLRTLPSLPVSSIPSLFTGYGMPRAGSRLSIQLIRLREA